MTAEDKRIVYGFSWAGPKGKLTQQEAAICLVCEVITSGSTRTTRLAVQPELPNDKEVLPTVDSLREEMRKSVKPFTWEP